MLGLAMDGGGARGVLQARLIERLDEETGFLRQVDFTAGTSIGGIGACYIAKHRSCSGLVNLFRDHAKTIFCQRDFFDGLSGFDELLRANYDQRGLRAALETVFDLDERLGDLALKCMVVAFDLDNMDEQSIATATQRYRVRTWKPKYGHNFDLSHADAQTLVIDWCLRTSAAPTYFPSYQGYVDGGVIDNNPSASALAKAVKEGFSLGHEADLLREVDQLLKELPYDDLHDDHRLWLGTLRVRIAGVLRNQIRILSIGTGVNPHYISGETHDYGYKQWLTDNRLLNMLFDGMLGPPDYMCRQLLADNYHRLNPTLPEVIDLDAADRVEDLIQLADEVDITETVDWLRVHAVGA